MTKQDQVNGSCHIIALGEVLPSLDRFMAMTIPTLFRVIGTLMGKDGMGHILLKADSS
jgi:hypothetical protein